MGSGMGRLILVIVAMVVVETAWALYCAVDNVNFFVFYGGLAAASVVFWVPGLSFKKTSSP